MSHLLSQLSGNFVDGSNLELVLRELEVIGLLDPGAADVREQLLAMEAAGRAAMDLTANKHLSWAEFKRLDAVAEREESAEGGAGAGERRE